MDNLGQRTATGSILAKHAHAGKISVEDIPLYWREEVRERLKELVGEKDSGEDTD